MRSLTTTSRPVIQFTVEDIGEDGFMSFLDTSVIPQPDGTLTSPVDKKPTHTDQYL